MSKCAIFSARNAVIDEINKRVVELLDMFKERIYTSTNSTENCGNNNDIDKVWLPRIFKYLLSPSFLLSYEIAFKTKLYYYVD